MAYSTQGDCPPFMGLFQAVIISWVSRIINDLGRVPSIPFVLRREIERVGHFELNHCDESQLFGVQVAHAGL